VKTTIEPGPDLLGEYALAARLGHEFSNVLAVVHSAGEGVAAVSGAIGEEGVAIVECARKAAKWTQRLTKLNVRPSRRIEPAELTLLGFESTTMRIEVAALPDVRLSIERRPIEEVVHELVQNAQDADATLLRVAARREDTDVILSLEDNGHGIAEATRARVFEPLFTTRSPERGKGVGLCIVHAVLHACGGRVALECLDGGTRVLLRIPMVQ
jgi:C4-dicarboxylate-specific signal transduction histidine kinase